MKNNSTENNRGAALYLVVVFTALAAALLLMLYAAAASNAMAGTAALRQMQTQFYAESVAEQFRAALLQTDLSAEAARETAASFTPSDLSDAQPYTVSFRPGAVTQSGGTVCIENCRIEVKEQDVLRVCLTFTVQIRRSADEMQTARQIRYTNYRFSHVQPEEESETYA